MGQPNRLLLGQTSLPIGSCEIAVDESLASLCLRLELAGRMWFVKRMLKMGRCGIKVASAPPNAHRSAVK